MESHELKPKRILNRAALAFPHQPALHELKFTEHHDKVICICNTKRTPQDRGPPKRKNKRLANSGFLLYYNIINYYDHTDKW